MKEFKALMDALEERNIPEKLKMTVSVVPLPEEVPEDKKQELINEAIKGCLMVSFDKDEELQDLYFDYITEIGMNAIIKELDIKPEKIDAKSAILNILEAITKSLKEE